MRHKAAIAVIIPTYNAERFVHEAIDSVRTQTISDWECVIVDDGSTDGTPNQLAAYRDPRIRSIRQDHRGDREARARGLSLTSAEKIVFLDADDCLYPDALARYVMCLERHAAADVAYGERTLIKEGGDSFALEWRAIFNKHPHGDALEAILRRPFLSTPSQACLRREAIPSIDWLGHHGIGGDWVMLAAAAIKHNFAYIGKAPVVKYRLHRGSFLRTLANDMQGTVNIQEFEELLHRLFSLPDLEGRLGVAKVRKLRHAAEATCLAIKGQEHLRCNNMRTARRYFSAALRSGSRDIRDILCWTATFCPRLILYAGPLFGTFESKTLSPLRKST
ncbi:MAG TPA: glycosyltransferase family 2 protein [Nitrospira sp.]|nr:glycosyltransferase family 2 protein [Nitrospira sp.]